MRTVWPLMAVAILPAAVKQLTYVVGQRSILWGERATLRKSAKRRYRVTQSPKPAQAGLPGLLR
jgi:hypothetical protein